MNLEASDRAAATADSHTAPKLGLALWFALALVASLSGLFSLDRAFLVPLFVLGTAAALTLLYRSAPSLRALVASLDPRWLFAVHAVRAPVGAWFLWLAAQHGFNATFATRAGYGDLVAGLWATALIALSSVGKSPSPRHLLAFNVVGLLDIVMVIFTAQNILFFGDRSSLVPFTWPGAPLILMVLVPLILTTHALMIGRAIRAMRAG